MNWRDIATVSLLLNCCWLGAEELSQETSPLQEERVSQEAPSLKTEDVSQETSSCCPETCSYQACPPDPCYVQGYLQALVDEKFDQCRVVVQVEGGTIWLLNFPENPLVADSVFSFIRCQSIAECYCVKVDCCRAVCPPPYSNSYRPQSGGIWLPDETVLFSPLIADPRQVGYSLGLRFFDKPISKSVIEISLGDTFPIYRWQDVWCWGGDLQLDIEGGIWSVFDNIRHSSPLVNTDFTIGFPLTYAIGKWSFRLRPTHISSHLGDEYIINNPGFTRYNRSINNVDFFTSYQLADEIRIYGGVGFKLLNDKSYRQDGSYLAAGAEVRLLGCRSCWDDLYAMPFLAMHLKSESNPELHKTHQNSTFLLGYEWGRLLGSGHKIRVFMEYHQGYSVEGVFTRFPTDYFGMRLSYGF